MITRSIDKFLNARVGVLQKKNLILTLPNGYRIELGNHRDSVEITFNSWLGIWLIFRRGALGFTEGYINKYWQTKDILDLMEYLLIKFLPELITILIKILSRGARKI